MRLQVLHTPYPGGDYSHKGRRKRQADGETESSLVHNHSHGQIVFRSSMDLITNLHSVLLPVTLLGRIDCVLKLSPVFPQAVLIIILYS